MNVGNKQADQLSNEEAERRATDALRRALSTPYKAQRELVGKVGRPTAPKRKSKKTNRAKL